MEQPFEPVETRSLHHISVMYVVVHDSREARTDERGVVHFSTGLEEVLDNLRTNALTSLLNNPLEQVVVLVHGAPGTPPSLQGSSRIFPSSSHHFSRLQEVEM